jgi:glycosyltransferase involved in cell wall biosynthesis
MKASIVLSYINRKKLFYETLLSIARTKCEDFEVICVDDCSREEERVEDFQSEFPFLKIIRLEPENKWYVNTCIQYNIGIKEAKGDVIILQNAECLHVNDVISHLVENVDDSNYISVSAYGLDPHSTFLLPGYREKHSLLNFFYGLPQRPYTGGDAPGWYNHSKFRPVFFHFCSGITKKNMDRLGGFDERYAYGTAYEDNDIIARINRMGLKIKIEDNFSVIHQWHPTCQYNHPNNAELTERNRQLFVNVTCRETNYYVDNSKLRK